MFQNYRRGELDTSLAYTRKNLFPTLHTNSTDSDKDLTFGPTRQFRPDGYKSGAISNL